MIDKKCETCDNIMENVNPKRKYCWGCIRAKYGVGDARQHNQADGGKVLRGGRNDKVEGKEVHKAKADSALPMPKVHPVVKKANRIPHKHKPSYHHSF